MLLALALLSPAPQFPESPTESRPAAPKTSPLAGIRWPREALPTSATRLMRPARPGVYFDAVGDRSFLCGTEDGGVESWVWPHQIFFDGKFAFRPAASLEAIPLERTASLL